jgi:alpha-mannosidase
MHWEQGRDPHKWLTVDEVPPEVKFINVETLAPGGCGNELQAFKDTPKEYDAWNIDPGALFEPIALPVRADRVELVGGQSRAAAVRVTRTWQSSKFVQTISLRTGADEVDIDNEIDWHERHVLLKAAFPLAVESDHATYEIPYGAIARATTRNTSWEEAQFEVPAMRWADLSGRSKDGRIHGASLINDSKYGYDCAGNVLRLTLLRAPTWPDPEADQGHHHFRYAIYPHLGTWKDAETVHRGWDFNYPLTAVVTTPHPGTPVAQNPVVGIYKMEHKDSVVITAVKKAEDGDALIVRLYESAGNDEKLYLNVPAGLAEARVANLMEEAAGDKLPLDEVRLLGQAHGVTLVPIHIHPYEILTIRLEYPERTARTSGNVF